MNLRKKFRFLFMFYILTLLIVIVPAGRVSAATGIKVISFSQKMRCVTLKWRLVNGASAYIITKRSANGKTGTIDYNSTARYRQRSCEFNDTRFGTADNGKTFCYHISAVDSRGKEIATATRYLVKIPTCATRRALPHWTHNCFRRKNWRSTTKSSRRVWENAFIRAAPIWPSLTAP